MLKICFKYASSILQVCFKHASSMLQVCFKYDSCMWVRFGEICVIISSLATLNEVRSRLARLEEDRA
jgi:hypothetical protein